MSVESPKMALTSAVFLNKSILKQDELRRRRQAIGSRVCVLDQHEFWIPAHVLAVGSDNSGLAVYTVQLESSAKILHDVNNLAGGIFGTPSTNFREGQQVFFTRGGKEIKANVVRHQGNQVWVQVHCGQDQEIEPILVGLDEIRLLESRKSPRLLSQECDQSSLQRSKAIEMPGKMRDYVQIPGSRKRRTSDCLIDDLEPNLDDTSNLSECSAALLLMKLSCSPCASVIASNDSAFESCSASTRSPAPSPTLSSSSCEDRLPKVIYQCTFPGCSVQSSSVSGIEMHVREVHLGLPVSQPSEDHEEEFYYTEIDVVGNELAPSSLLDHLDMARPAHEDPSRISSSVPVVLGPKLMVISPKKGAKREGKKCRKVYGVEQRELWCTQCKWKKACTRFGQNNKAEEESKTSPLSSPSSLASTGSLLPNSNAVKALKF